MLTVTSIVAFRDTDDREHDDKHLTHSDIYYVYSFLNYAFRIWIDFVFIMLINA